MLETHVAHDSVSGVYPSLRTGALPSIRVHEGFIVLCFSCVQNALGEDDVFRKG